MLAGDDTRPRHNSSYGGLNDNFNFLDDSRLISLLNKTGGNHTPIEEWLKALEDLRNKYNISVVKECDRFDYCSGEFRELIFAYNSIHGYISLLVSK